MATPNYFKADPADPDWQFSPEEYFQKDFRLLGTSTVTLETGKDDSIVLRQNPTEKDLLAKHICITVKPHARLDILILNDLDPSMQQMFLYDVHLQEGATATLGIFAKGGKFNKHIVQVVQDDGSTYESYGIASNEVGGDTEIISKIVHAGSDTVSTQLFLGLAGEQSQTVYQTMILSEGDAINNDIVVNSDNLVTGIGGRCFSKPDTYIDTEFTKSAIASQTSYIGDQELCYLQSRGLSSDDARELIINGFKNKVFQLLANDAIRDEIREQF